MRIVLSGDRLTLEQVAAVTLGGARIELAGSSRAGARAARALVERIAAGDTPTYGINTGFGTLAEVSIPKTDLRKLQRNLILSHAAGPERRFGARGARADAPARQRSRRRVLGIRETT